MKRRSIFGINAFCRILVICVLVASFPLTPVLAVLKRKKDPAPKIGKIFIVSPKSNNIIASGGAITLRYNVNDADITSIKIKVSNGIDASSGIAGMNDARVHLYPGVNTIDVFGLNASGPDAEARATINVECNSECISGTLPPGGMVQPASGQPVPAAVTTPTPAAGPSPAAVSTTPKNIALRLPTTMPVNAATVEPTVLIQEKSGITRLVIDVYQNGQRLDSADVKKIDFQDGLAIVTAKLKIADGANEVHAFDPLHFGEQGFFTSATLTCKGDKCVTAAQASTSGATAGGAETPPITILRPENPTKVNASKIDVYLKVAKAEIKKLRYEVLNGETVLLSDTVDIQDKNEEARKEFPVSVRIIKGTNTIAFFNEADRKELKQRDAIDVVCEGDHCPENFDVAQFSSSGQNRRVIVGFEQAGGSSALSETKPVLDFFFMLPFIFDPQRRCAKLPDNPTEAQRIIYDDCVARNLRRRQEPRLGFWGDVRLAATPDQIAAAQVFPTSLVNQVDKPKSIDLVQSFDFLAGVEGKLKSATGTFLSPIPGLRQKMVLYFAAGAGAISPLTTRKESIQIFNVPGVNDARRAEFINRYGTPPDGKEFIAVVPIDRDRFLRQWYGGLRLKTFYCDDSECNRFKNSFPAIVDFMFGQNEAVTGGSRKHGGTLDPNNPDKLIGQKNAYVLRVDGFYPFPIKEASFIYFYGTAIMKVGGGGAKITTPLFLDNPGTTVEISDPKVYMPPTNILRLQQPDRDYYKFGVGVNLTDLLNRKSSPQ